MMIPLLLSIAVANATEPVDFGLAWKAGDKFTYVVSESMLNTSGEFVLTVVSVDEKSTTVRNSLIDYTKMLKSVQPGTSKITRKGRVMSSGSIGIAAYLNMFLLPAKLVDVGDEFEIVFPLADLKVNMKGKFSKREGKDNSLAVFEMNGLLGETSNSKLVAKVTSVFDTVRGIFVSAKLEIGEENSKSISTSLIKLKEAKI